MVEGLELSISYLMIPVFLVQVTHLHHFRIVEIDNVKIKESQVGIIITNSVNTDVSRMILDQIGLSFALGIQIIRLSPELENGFKWDLLINPIPQEISNQLRFIIILVKRIRPYGMHWSDYSKYHDHYAP